MIVQPSFYGTDNSLLLESLDVLTGSGRGVAVINPETTSAGRCPAWPGRACAGCGSISTARCAKRHRSPAGSKPSTGLAHESELAHRSHRAASNCWPKVRRCCANSRVPVVIDHYGFYSGFTSRNSWTAARCSACSAMSHVWIKLSAPYRVSSESVGDQTGPGLACSDLAVAPDRCVWGSDWPHTPPHEQQMGSAVLSPYRSLRYETLVDDFMEAVGGAESAERILSDNPARLYGFE